MKNTCSPKQYTSLPLHSHKDRSTHVVPGTGTHSPGAGQGAEGRGQRPRAEVTEGRGQRAERAEGRGHLRKCRPALLPPCPALPCPCLALLLLHDQTSTKEENHGMSLELNPPKRNRFGRFGHLRRCRVGEKGKSPPRSGSSGKSS